MQLCMQLYQVYQSIIYSMYIHVVGQNDKLNKTVRRIILIYFLVELNRMPKLQTDIVKRMTYTLLKSLSIHIKFYNNTHDISSECG